MNFVKKMDYFLFQTKLKAQKKVNEFLYDEKGDTNFISIMVLLGIALALAAVFLNFKDQVIDWVNDNVGDFFGSNAGSKKIEGR